MLFKSGSEFMICKREVGTDKDKTLHIYLREIMTGLAKNTVVWCDHKIHASNHFKHHNWARIVKEDNP